MDHSVRFIVPFEIGLKFTQGACGSFAQSLVDKFGGEIMAMSSPQWEATEVPGHPNEYFHNPFHYVALVHGNYIDITDVYSSYDSLINFWRGYLSNMIRTKFTIAVTRVKNVICSRQDINTAHREVIRYLQSKDLSPDQNYLVKFVWPGVAYLDNAIFCLTLVENIGGVIYGIKIVGDYHVPFRYIAAINGVYIDQTGIYHDIESLSERVIDEAKELGGDEVEMISVDENLGNPDYSYTQNDIRQMNNYIKLILPTIIRII